MTGLHYLTPEQIDLSKIIFQYKVIEDNKFIIDEIDRIVDFDGSVKNSASKELQKIRKDLSDKCRNESPAVSARPPQPQTQEQYQRFPKK